jgi:co-chaperonin GroES (HSP10)
MSVPLRVLGDRVLVRPDVSANTPEVLDSGVVIATSLAAAVTGADPTTSVHRGTVVAVGNPRHPLQHEAESLARVIQRRARASSVASGEDDSPEADAAHLLRDLVRRHACVRIGEDVLFAHDVGQDVDLEGKRHILLHEGDLLAVVEPL